MHVQLLKSHIATRSIIFASMAGNARKMVSHIPFDAVSRVHRDEPLHFLELLDRYGLALYPNQHLASGEMEFPKETANESADCEPISTTHGQVAVAVSNATADQRKAEQMQSEIDVLLSDINGRAVSDLEDWRQWRSKLERSDLFEHYNDQKLWDVVFHSVNEQLKTKIHFKPANKPDRITTAENLSILLDMYEADLFPPEEAVIEISWPPLFEGPPSNTYEDWLIWKKIVHKCQADFDFSNNIMRQIILAATSKEPTANKINKCDDSSAEDFRVLLDRLETNMFPHGGRADPPASASFSAPCFSSAADSAV